MKVLTLSFLLLFALVGSQSAQDRKPSQSLRPFVVKTKQSVDELEKVPGIGPGTMKQIRSQVTVSGKTATDKAADKGTQTKASDVKKSETSKSDSMKSDTAKAKTSSDNSKSDSMKSDTAKTKSAEKK